jgi:hypothetical protein
MIDDFPSPPPFVAQTRREAVTQEPEPLGDRCDPQHEDQDWIGAAQQGGGLVPEDFVWASNPKLWQERLSAG